MSNSPQAQTTRRAPIDRVPSPLRRLFGRALHLYFRMSRGLTLGARGLHLGAEAAQRLRFGHGDEGRIVWACIREGGRRGRDR